MKKFLPIVLLILISTFLIFYRFTDIPKYLAFDEVEFTKLALSLDKKPYIPYSQLATGHSTLYFYILLASLKTFGINTFALRFPSAVFGILSVLFFYLIIKRVFKQSSNGTIKQFLPFILTLILLSSRWFLNFARFSFETTFLLFLELTSIYFLIKSNVILGRIRQSAEATPESLSDSGRAPSSLARMTCIAISGLFAGLAFLSYTPGRIFFLLPLSFFVFKLVNSQTRKQFSNKIIKQILYFIVPFLIVIALLTTYLMTNKDTRIDQQFFLKNNEMTINKKISGLWQNISSTALMFNIKGDVNGRHNYPNKPALNPILGILFIAGLFISIKGFKKIYNKLFLFYFLLSLFPALMTYPWENPNMLRTYTSLPAIVYFIGVGINVILGRNKVTTPESLSDSGHALSSLVRMTFIIIIIFFSSYYELRTYFKYQSTVFKQSFEIKLPLEKAIKTKLKP